MHFEGLIRLTLKYLRLDVTYFLVLNKHEINEQVLIVTPDTVRRITSSELRKIKVTVLDSKAHTKLLITSPLLFDKNFI